jgi:hypothetical protein
MSQNADKQSLTLQDLERFLADPDDDQAFLDYFLAAAVLVALDPFNWQPNPAGLSESVDAGAVSDKDLDAERREDLLGQLLPLCEQILNGPLRGMWSMNFADRRSYLRMLKTRERMRKALDATADRPNTTLQNMFERVIDQRTIELENLSRDEIAALVTVLSWTDGILEDIPDREEVQSFLARADLLAPMRRLVRHGFINREQELEHLDRYIYDSPEYQAPLFVFGSGGSGKSTLLAQFVLEFLNKRRTPFAYIDIDRPTLQAQEPLSILIEIIYQLQKQVPLGEKVDGLVNQMIRDISRQEESRYTESATVRRGPSYYLKRLDREIYNAQSRTETAGTQIVIILDTFEEAQWLGLEVVDRLMDFVFDLASSAQFKVILSGRVLPLEYVKRAFPGKMEATGTENFESEEFLQVINLPARPINVSMVGDGPSRELLNDAVVRMGMVKLDNEELRDIINIASRNPMCLILAARLLKAVGIEKLRAAPGEFLSQLRSEKRQALLYGRILHHIHIEDVSKVAYPGLVVRRITPALIRKVLAGPCKLELTKDRDEYAIFADLAKEVALVRLDPEDQSLRHRVDVRRAMLEDLTDHVDKDIVEAINSAAIAFYQDDPEPVARAEEIYHRLRRGEEEDVLNVRWLPEAGRYLKDAGEELPARERLWLAEKLGITLDESVRETATQEVWEDQVERSAERYLEGGDGEMALKVLQERADRLPGSPLYALEAEAYRILDIPEEALRVGRQGVEALSKVGAADMTLDLLLNMVVIEEGRERLEAADRLMDEAMAISSYTNDSLKKLRVRVTKLRLLRKLDDEESGAQIRAEALESLTEEMLRKLRKHPVLLRETAAELGADSPALNQEAISTLGLEVVTEDQAYLVNEALQALAKEGGGVNMGVNIEGDVIQGDTISIGNLQDTVSGLSKAQTSQIGQQVGRIKVGSDVHIGFQANFRASVEQSLRGRKLLQPFFIPNEEAPLQKPKVQDSYLGLRMLEINLNSRRVLFQKAIPAFHINSRFVGLQGIEESNFVFKPDNEGGAPEGSLQTNQQVFGPLLYRGGNIDLVIGLYAAQMTDWANYFIQLAEDVSRLALNSDLTTMLAISRAVKESVEDLFLSVGTDITLGLSISLQPDFWLAPGYLVMISGSEEDVLIEDLIVEEEQLRHVDGRPFIDKDFILMAIEFSEYRSDWQKLGFGDLWQELLKTAAESDDLQAVKDAYVMFSGAILSSEDLSWSDKRGIIEVSQDRIKAIRDARQNFELLDNLTEADLDIGQATEVADKTVTELVDSDWVDV